MKYYKIKDGTGDFHSKNSGKLHEELIGAIGEQGDPQGWYLTTSDLEVHVVIIDKSIERELVDAVVRHHFKTDWDKYVEPDPKEDIRKRVGEATTIKELKGLLLEVIK